MCAGCVLYGYIVVFSSLLRHILPQNQKGETEPSHCQHSTMNHQNEHTMEVTHRMDDDNRRRHRRNRRFHQGWELLLLAIGFLTLAPASCRIGVAVVVDANRYCSSRDYSCGWSGRRKYYNNIANEDDINCDYDFHSSIDYDRRAGQKRRFPRTYEYHRRPYNGRYIHQRKNWNSMNTRQYDCNRGGHLMTDLTRDILSIPKSMINSLLRQNLNHQHQKRRSHPKKNTQPNAVDGDDWEDPTADGAQQQHQSGAAPNYYAIEDMGSHFQLTLEVPGVDGRDLEVALIQEKGITILQVRGTRYGSRRSGLVVKSTFMEAFEFLDKDVQIDVDAIEVQLSSEIVTVIAPKKKKTRPEGQTRKRRLLDISTDGVDQRNHASQYESIPVEKKTDEGRSNLPDDDESLYISEDEDVWQ
jgi:HSP20 family molecular chaperone IbpA